MKYTKYLIFYLILSSSMLLAFGCANKKIVKITTKPNMSEIYIGGKKVGNSPMSKEMVFEKNKGIEVVAKKSGFRDGKINVKYEPNIRKNYHMILEKRDSVKVNFIDFDGVDTGNGIKVTPIQKDTISFLEVIEKSPNVKSVTRMTNNEDQELQMGPPVLSPVEDIFVYRIYVEEKDKSGKTTNNYSNIWRQNVGEFGKARVTYGKWMDMYPTFTTNGEYLIFSSNRTSVNPTLWKIKFDGGGGIIKITGSMAEDFSPHVAPSNNAIIYASNPPGVSDSQLWKINMIGNLPTQLRVGEVPQVSPDGKKILFIRREKEKRKKQVWVMNIDGSGETQISQNLDYDILNPKWSPDGRYIIYSSNESFDLYKRRNYDIWIMTAGGESKTQLTTNGSWDDSPVWDRNGQYIYFRSNRGGAWNIWRFKPILN